MEDILETHGYGQILESRAPMPLPQGGRVDGWLGPPSGFSPFVSVPINSNRFRGFGGNKRDVEEVLETRNSEAGLVARSPIPYRPMPRLRGFGNTRNAIRVGNAGHAIFPGRR